MTQASMIKNGLKIILEGEPASVVEHAFVKPGKGQAFVRVKLRLLRLRRQVEHTFKSSESIELADVEDRDMQFLYQDGHHWHFMEEATCEQHTAGESAMDDAAPWIQPQDVCSVTLWNGEPLSVQPPNFVQLSVASTEPGVRGDTSGGGSKSATLSTGVVIRVPLFVEVGDVLRVDTRTGEYTKRL